MRFQWPKLVRRASLAFNLLLLIGFAAALYFVFSKERVSTKVSGAPNVIDGDTVRIGGQSLRLVGLDAPERDQTCKSATGEFWNCGEEARQRLQELAADGIWTCQISGHDRYGRNLASCVMEHKTLLGQDPAEIMVAEGWAISSGRFNDAEALAKAAKRGIHAGSFLTPRQWRDGFRWPEQGEQGGSVFDWLVDWFAELFA
ncbi:MAG: thermonuclease family protein [Hyphomicrobiaceae bacterium]|nr:thermonuclease family protein [Hyphomicrobiaceae bacterium]